MKSQIFLFLSLLLILGCGGESTQTATTKNTKPAEAETATDTQAAAAKKSKAKYILFFGDSITAGYGLDEKDAFTSLIQDKLEKMDLDYKVVNAGLSGETTAGGARRINWVLKQQVDIFVLELGGNDMLRGLDVVQTETNLRSILETVRKKYPDIPIVIAGMQAPSNMGKDYVVTFNNIFPKLAKEFNAGLIPFVLQGVAGNPALNLPDGIHPNAKGEKIVMENIWKVLKDYL